jgi:cytidylate kinase
MLETDSSVQRLTEAMAGAQRHWRQRSHEAAPADTFPPSASAPTIALHREAGSGGTRLAHEVGRQLGWPVYDHELLEHIAQEKGLRLSLLKSVDERRRSWLEETAEMFASAPGVTENAYVRYLIETVLSLGAHGECVIVGRGAGFLLPAATTLRVRVIASEPDRIQNTSQRLGLSTADAARWVRDTERDRVAFVRAHFQKDPSDAINYDLVLNSSRWSVEEGAQLIVDALHQFQHRSGRKAALVTAS